MYFIQRAADSAAPSALRAGEDRARIRIVPRFVEAFARVVQAHIANQRMFSKVLRYLEQLAKVSGRLIEQGVSPDAPQLQLQIASCVDTTVGHHSNIDLDLPDLDSKAR